MTILIPNMLTKKQIENFQIIYKNIYGVDISNEQAETEGLDMIQFIAVILEAKYQK